MKETDLNYLYQNERIIFLYFEIVIIFNIICIKY